MKRVNPKTNEKYNKKTRFSKIPHPYIVVEDKDEIKTPYDLYRSINMMENHYWLDFAQYHVFRHEIIKNLPFSEQLQLYLLGLEQGPKNQLISELSKQGYNPFEDYISDFFLSENIFNYVINKKVELQKIAQIIKENLIIEKNILILPINQIDNFKLSVLKYIGINVIIIFNDENCEIVLNNEDRKFYEIRGKSIKIKNIYNILKEFNVNWLLENNRLINHKNTDTINEIITTIKTNIF